MGKGHLHFLAIIAGLFVGRCLGQRPGMVTRLFMDGAGNLARWGAGTALGFERANHAVVFAGTIDDGVVFGDACPLLFERAPITLQRRPPGHR